jgi:hypothetical protein
VLFEQLPGASCEGPALYWGQQLPGAALAFGRFAAVTARQSRRRGEEASSATGALARGVVRYVSSAIRLVKLQIWLQPTNRSMRGYICVERSIMRRLIALAARSTELALSYLLDAAAAASFVARRAKQSLP